MGVPKCTLMIEYVRDKTLITKRVIQLYDPDYCQETLDSALSTWWSNIRKNGGLGLTVVGKEAFDLAGLEYWDVPVKLGEILKTTTRLALDRNMQCPWFLTGVGVGGKNKLLKPMLRLYDSRVTSMVILHGGLEAYVDNYRKK